jgi:hypothetical protein
MALARGMIVNPVTGNVPTLQVPFEQLYAKMQQYQLEKDTYGQLSKTMPNYISQDTDAAVAYKNLTSKLSDSVTNSFAQGDTQNAIRTMRQAQEELRKQWQPGGLANALNSRYGQYQEATKAITEGTKNNKSSVYGEYYKDQLNQSVGKGIGYDPERGTYNSIAAPTVGKEVILGDEVDQFLEGWMADKGVQISKSADGMWYNKVTQEQVDPNELTKALDTFYKQPHIQESLGVYGWDRARRMDPNQARELYRSKLMGSLDAQNKQLDGLQSIVNGGNRRQIQDLQEDLKAKGYNLDADGIAGPKTKEALSDYIKSVQDESATLKGQIDQNIQNVDPRQFAIEDLKNELTNTYVPKHAYTKRDVDMIANQPALVRLRAGLQAKAMEGLKALMFPPSATLMAPVTTNPVTVESISAQYTSAKKDYKQLESQVMSTLSPEWKKTMASYGVDGHRSSTLMFQAAQAATKNGKFDPTRFKQALKQQGVNLPDAELDRQARLLTSPNNRGILEGLHDQLVPAAQSMKISEEMFNQYTASALKSNKIDWTEVARNGRFGISIGGTRGSRFAPTEEAAKKAYEEGNPEAIKWVNAQTGRMSAADKSQIFKSEVGVNAILNEKLKPFEKQLKDQANLSISAIVDYSKLDKSTLAKLGIDKKGNVLRDGSSGKPKVTTDMVNIGATTINGKSVPTILIKTSAMDSPIAIPMNAVNANWKSTLVNNIAATGLNPNKPGEIIDQQSFDAAAVLRFDMDQDEGSGFSASTIQRRANGTPGPVGLTIVKTGRGTTQLQTFVVKDKDGSGSYLVSTSSQAEAEALNKNPNVSITKYQQTESSVAVPINKDYNSINQAIMKTKAYLYKGEVMQQAFDEPYNVTRQPSNMTANPAVLQSYFEALNND